MQAQRWGQPRAARRGQCPTTPQPPSSAFVPVNVLGNSLATIVMARMERAVDLPTLQSKLQSGPEETAQASAL